MERKLASLQHIREILPIEGADMIELAIVNAWKVVVAKSVGHKVGDLVVYCEIDSFLPIQEEYEFLRKSSYKKLAYGSEGFRLKTIKLKGQISQGLILPLSVLLTKITGPISLQEGDDVSDILGIVKYDPPVPANLAGIAKGNFPGFIRKTDEERVQNLEKDYEKMKASRYYVTEKLDGSSSTFYIRDGEFGICSRNLELAEPEPFVPGEVIGEDGISRPKKENSFWKFANDTGLKNRMRDQERNFAIQGELIGEGIQGNPYKIKGQTVKFFNVFNIDTQEYESFEEFVNTIKSMNLDIVPVLDSDFQLPETIDELLAYSEGKSILEPAAEREGVVIRSLDRKISFKAISNLFLLKEK